MSKVKKALRKERKGNRPPFELAVMNGELQFTGRGNISSRLR